VRADEIVTCKVDLAMMHDSGGPRRVDSKLRFLGVGIWDPNKVVVVSDHYVPAVDLDSAHILQFTRAWVREHGIKHFYDMRGICHVVLPEHGHLQPGMFVVGGDSHSPTGGAFGAFMIGIGATEMAGVLATGEIWVRVPRTIRIELASTMPTGVSVKDVLLHLCANLGMENEYRVIEFCGPAMSSLPMHERMTLCNMTAELGAKTGLIAADETTFAYLHSVGRTDLAISTEWRSDTEAHFEQSFTIDLTNLNPQVAAPSSPANAASVSSHLGTHVDQAYLGACTGAKLIDLQMAARVLKGRQVRARTLIAPASARTVIEATRDGTLATLTEAGAILLPSGCGACAGLGAGLLASKEVCIASTARNFKGRMGAKDSLVYLASPYTVAASALAGHIADPRDYL
jgi:3-isopropylmalate/(R)-2-methylmalate dehydratase large subunit